MRTHRSGRKTDFQIHYTDLNVWLKDLPNTTMIEIEDTGARFGRVLFARLPSHRGPVTDSPIIGSYLLTKGHGKIWNSVLAPEKRI